VTRVSLDWIVIAVSLTVCFIPALLLARRASSSTAEFFTSGRAAPWWLIGVSMVATTFSTDTPNLVTNLVRENGVANNWVWWAFLLTGMLTVFFYARLWRRSGVLTDLEFYDIRYAGRAATVVRGFRAVYLGVLFNCFIMASVNLAAVKIANVLLGWPMSQTLLICAALNIAFAMIAGLWGVLVTDLIQFGIAMTGAVAAAYYALQQPEVGGLAQLIARSDPASLALLPDFSDWTLTLTVFVIPLTIQWWSVWYPGAEPGGGSYIAQRMLAARSASTSPASSGPSGPTSTASTSCLVANATRAGTSVTETGTQVASDAMPGLPGAAISSRSGSSWRRRHASACSRPPPPTNRSRVTGPSWR
jgi:Na+/proline symporter